MPNDTLHTSSDSGSGTAVYSGDRAVSPEGGGSLQQNTGKQDGKGDGFPTEYDSAANSFWTITVPFSLALLIPFLVRLYKMYGARKQVRRTLQSKSDSYHDLLNRHIHYYRQLPMEQQVKFLRRVTAFMHAREFRYMNIDKEEKMPLLISAAAVQLTFGLNEYLLDHFKIIYVLKEDYRYGHYNMPFMGHVDHSGIYLSWNNFLRGFENYNDAHNVGIHEMAHALAYVNFMSDSGHDPHFRSEFRDFSKIARPIFNRMQHGEQNLLDTYASTNYNEFWAVSVETFFEKPRQMRAEMGELYEAMCSLLNQDPLSWMEGNSDSNV